MRPSCSDRRAVACGVIAVAWLACSPPEPQTPIAAPPPSATAVTPLPTPAPAARRRGRVLLAEPRETALGFVLQPIPGGRSALAVAQLAGRARAPGCGASTEARERRGRCCASSIDTSSARSIGETAPSPASRPTARASASIVRRRRPRLEPASRATPRRSSRSAIGSRSWSSLPMHPPEPAGRGARPAPKPAGETRGAAPQGRGQERGEDLQGRPRRRPRTPAPRAGRRTRWSSCSVRWVDASGGDRRRVAAHGPALRGAPRRHDAGRRARVGRPASTCSGSRPRPRARPAPRLGSGRLMAASLRADGSLDFASRVAVVDADLEYGQLKDHHAPRLVGSDAASRLPRPRRQGPVRGHPRAPDARRTSRRRPRVCAVAPDRVVGAGRRRRGRGLRPHPRRRAPPRLRPAAERPRARRLGRRSRLLPARRRAALGVARRRGAPRDEPPPFLAAPRAHRLGRASRPTARAWRSPSGARRARRRRARGVERAPLPRGRRPRVVGAPELPADRRRAARIGATWWTARGARARALADAVTRRATPRRAPPRHLGPRRRRRSRGLSLELAGGALARRAPSTRPAPPRPSAPSLPAPVRPGFDACERAGGGALVAGVSAADPGKVVAFTVDAAGRTGAAQRRPAPHPRGRARRAPRAAPLGRRAAHRSRAAATSSGSTTTRAPSATPPGPPPRATPSASTAAPCRSPSPAPDAGQLVACARRRRGRLHRRRRRLGPRRLPALVRRHRRGPRLRPRGRRAPAPPAAASPRPRPAPAPALAPARRARTPRRARLPPRHGLHRRPLLRRSLRGHDRRRPHRRAPLARLPHHPQPPRLRPRPSGPPPASAPATSTPAPSRCRGSRPRASATSPSRVAVSRLGVRPSGYLTGVVAEAACAAAGKRLCSLDEFVTACRGQDDTLFPYGDTYEDGVCNVFREEHPAALLHGNASIGHLNPRLNRVLSQGRPLLQRTGESPACRSRWGDDAVYDMVGNLDEWVDEGAGAFAGGFYSRSTRSGCEAVVTAHPKAYLDYSTGRAVLPGQAVITMGPRAAPNPGLLRRPDPCADAYPGAVSAAHDPPGDLRALLARCPGGAVRDGLHDAGHLAELGGWRPLRRGARPHRRSGSEGRARAPAHRQPARAGRRQAHPHHAHRVDRPAGDGDAHARRGAEARPGGAAQESAAAPTSTRW